MLSLLDKEYEVLGSLFSGSLSYLSQEEYTLFAKDVREAKKDTRDFLGGERLSFPIEDSNVMLEQGERDFKVAFSKYLLETLGRSKLYYQLRILVEASSLTSNKLIKENIKFTKELGKLFSATEFEYLKDDIVLRYSQMKNSFILPQGKIVISTHPIDFLFMGQGRGWDTCYKYKGEHHTGAYSSALDPDTFLVFLNVGEEYSPESNIYRRMGMLTKKKTGMVLSVQYPYKNDTIESIIVKILSEKYFTENLLVEKKLDIKIHKQPGSQVYNDFVSNPKNEKLYIGKKDYEKDLLHYGKVVPCLRCREDRALIDLPYCFDCHLDVFNIDEEEFDAGSK